MSHLGHRAASAEEIDVDLSLEAEVVEAEIEHALLLKGYCVLGLGIDDETQVHALEKLKHFNVVDCKFEPPPAEIIEGLLGADGSGEIYQLPLPEQQDLDDSEHLRDIDTTISSVAENCVRFIDSLDPDVPVTRTPSLVIRGGGQEFDAPELTEEMCAQWLSTFHQAKLMLIYFLGPNDGKLELQPFDEDSGTVEVPVKPDTMVILRSDVLSHRYPSTDSDYTICCWLTTSGSMTGTNGWKYTNPNITKAMPAARELEAWAKERCQDIYTQKLEGTLDEGDVPREWMRLVHHQYFGVNQNPIAVRGESGHVPAEYDSESLWWGMFSGADFVTDICFNKRWDHKEHYDPDPNSFMQSDSFRSTNSFVKTAVRHHSFIDGCDMFDHKKFNMSRMEVKEIDPLQRHCLETNYECLFSAGMSKQELMGANVGIFTGCTASEWNYTENAANAIGSAGLMQCAIANRTSFFLGLKGPSTTIDCEMASALTAIIVGSATLSSDSSKRGRGGSDCEAVCCSGVHIAMTALLWPRFSSWMNPVGRCFTFDDSAGGYVRGEMCGSVCLKTYADRIDNDVVVQSDAPCLGTIVGMRTTNNGRAASLTASSGPAEQEACRDSVEDAGIDVLDVDGMECHGSGNALADSVEVTSVYTVLRGGGVEDPLVLTAVKTNVGAQCEAAGMGQFTKVLYSILHGVSVPSLHLKQVNQWIEPDLYSGGPVHMPVEALPHKEQHCFHGVASRGWGGTNVNMVLWYYADPQRVPAEKVHLDRQEFDFWPGGGGTLDGDAKPSEGYFIVGSWHSTGEPQEMIRTGEGTYMHTVTMGSNGFETFQILIDGERDRVLHPNRTKASSPSKVMGPSDNGVTVKSLKWMIDGRGVRYESQGRSADGSSTGTEIITYPSRDRGGLGDQYEVKLMINGMYRAVAWKKVKSADSGTSITPEMLAGAYHIVGTFNDWTHQAMMPGPSPGTWVVEVGPLRHRGGEFQIIRNRDPDQAFYPASGFGDMSDEVIGPNELGQGMNWNLRGNPDSVFQVTFKRTIEDGKEVRTVSWSQRSRRK